MKRVFILGDTGLIGRAVIKELKEAYEIVGASRQELPNADWTHVVFDLEKECLMPILERYSPDIIISCTRGDFEKQMNTHMEIMDYAIKTDVKVYFFSTANVFDGIPNSIRSESDITNAISDYGKFKAECEKRLLEKLNENVVILRLPMVFGEKSPRVEAIIDANHRVKTIELYENLVFTTILDTQVAEQLHFIMDEGLVGIFHLTSKDVSNHMAFYKRILNSLALVEIGKIKHEGTYYLALRSERHELAQFQYTNGEVARQIKRIVKLRSVE